MGTSQQDLEARAEQIREAIRSGSIDRASRNTLVTYSAWLCERESTGPFSTATEHAQVAELVRVHLLRSMIDAFEQRSRAQYYWILFFAVLAILAQVLPYIVAPSPVLGTATSSKESTAGQVEGARQAQTQTHSLPRQPQLAPSSPASASSQGTVSR